MRVTHATPAPLYAHSADRRWECEASMPVGSEQCKDIARQLIEDWPGKDFQVQQNKHPKAIQRQNVTLYTSKVLFIQKKFLSQSPNSIIRFPVSWLSKCWSDGFCYN